MSGTPAARGRAWPEADALFHRDPNWIGGDDAATVPLGDGRTLWLFGDTFLASAPGTGRRAAHFVNNTIAVQTGADPVRASISFHHGQWEGAPGSFFPGDGERWLWPLHGVAANGSLLLFFMVVRSSTAEERAADPIERWRQLGVLSFFRVTGWTARLVRNPHDDPSQWVVETPRLPSETGPPVLGAAVLAEDGFALAYGWEDGGRRITLARWPLDAAMDGDLGAPEWWCGDGWRTGGAPAAVFERGATEFSVHRDAASGLLCQVQTTRVLKGTIGLRWAERPEGPWSAPVPAFTPDEADRGDVILYAGKAHPELDGPGLVVTYASNAAVDVTLDDMSVYFPRFATITWEGP